MYNDKIENYLRRHDYTGIRLRAVLFDMDGVLFDSMPNHARAWHEAMALYGMHLSPEEAYMHEGRTGAATINIVSRRERGTDATPEEIERIYKTKTDTVSKLECMEFPTIIEKELTGWQKLRMYAGDITLIMLCGLLIWCLYWFVRDLISRRKNN